MGHINSFCFVFLINLISAENFSNPLVLNSLAFVYPAQKRFELDLKRIWKRAGLKNPPEGWTAPKIFIKQHGNKAD